MNHIVNQPARGYEASVPTDFLRYATDPYRARLKAMKFIKPYLRSLSHDGVRWGPSTFRPPELKNGSYNQTARQQVVEQFQFYRILPAYDEIAALHDTVGLAANTEETASLAEIEMLVTGFFASVDAGKNAARIDRLIFALEFEADIEGHNLYILASALYRYQRAKPFLPEPADVLSEIGDLRKHFCSLYGWIADILCMYDGMVWDFYLFDLLKREELPARVARLVDDAEGRWGDPDGEPAAASPPMM